jgi:hypothetical protein
MEAIEIKSVDKAMFLNDLLDLLVGEETDQNWLNKVVNNLNSGIEHGYIVGEELIAEVKAVADYINNPPEVQSDATIKVLRVRKAESLIHKIILSSKDENSIRKLQNITS